MPHVYRRQQIVGVQRLRSVFLGFAALLCVLPGLAQSQALNDEELLTAMIATVVTHDLGIPIGLLPFPVTQLAGEAVQYGGNIGLKAYRPYLTVPDTWSSPVAFRPSDDGDADNCSFKFYLPNASGDYENMFGIINMRSSYYDATTDTSFAWQDRWGVLPPPDIYHANSTARLDVRVSEKVRRRNAGDTSYMTFPLSVKETREREEKGEVLTGNETTEFYHPILDPWAPVPGTPRAFNVPQPAKEDRDGELAVDGSQWVYMPVGEHTMEWTGATQLNVLGDVVVPGALLAFAVHSEIKTARAGVKATKKVKDAGGITRDVVKQADNQADSAATRLANRKFDSIWEHFFTRSRPGPIGEQVRALMCKQTVNVLASLLDKVIGYGVTVLEEETGAYLQSRGQLTELQRKALDTIFKIVLEEGLAEGTGAIKSHIINNGCGAGSGGNLPFVLKWTVRALQIKMLQPYATFDTGISKLGQPFIVYDDSPPMWTQDPAPLTLEATDFGGTRLFRAANEMHASASAVVTDECGGAPELVNDAPELLLLDEPTVVTWIARDLRAHPPGSDPDLYAPTATQTITVLDRQPPLLLAPPSKVFEASDSEKVIGDAVAVDLADVQPVITNDLPSDPFEFPVDERTTIVWTATDQSLNSSEATQVITVKTDGTNNRPVADTGITASTRTAESVPIRLTASDPDILGGVADPLWFKIEAQPQNGEFIAPLYPFFIEDYRTKPGDALGDAYDPAGTQTLSDYIVENFCAQNEPAPLGFVHEAKFVHVTDDGIRYVLDNYFECGLSGELPIRQRISKWNADGTFINQMRLDGGADNQPYSDTFNVDPDGKLRYFTIVSSSTSSATIGLWECETDFVDNSGRNNSSSADECSLFNSTEQVTDNATLRYARFDSKLNIAYVADDFSIFAYETSDTSTNLRFLAELGPTDANGVLDDWIGDTAALDVGSDSSLYIADELHHRIHKIGPASRNAQGEVVLGEYVGWSGACTGSDNKACDDNLGRSRGYSCTFDANSCTPSLAELETSAGRASATGNAQGQFNTPKYIAIDPNDVLYVADYENARIQRLSPDGSFAGEAISDGTGINKGARPSFVLGNMGKPASVSVNSTQFFVVDQDAQFVHVFGTLPFDDITEDAVTVTYVSDQAFPNPDVSAVDTFAFSVSDGLAESEPATVNITVDRNFRPPIALSETVQAVEDTELIFALPADDPDGVKEDGDFLGLDTLTYTVTDQPRHGTLTGSGKFRTYMPDPDYYGDDTLQFRVNDGRDDSNIATLTIEVQAVNDPPVVTIDVPEVAARGFASMVTTTFLDDPSDGYEAGAIWGDNQFSVTGGFVDDNLENPRIVGVAIANPPLPEIEGRTFAEHVYNDVGQYLVAICVTDSGGETGCDLAPISVEPLVSLGIGGSVYSAPLPDDVVTEQQIDDGLEFTYEVNVINELPVGVPGLVATDVMLQATLPDRVIFGELSVDRGNCTRTNRSVSCSFGDMLAGEEANILIQAFGPGNLIYDDDHDIDATLSTSAPALKDEMDFLLSVELIADDTDSDNDGMSDSYEQTYGLNPGLDDSAGDNDGDGLSNLREFELGTSPTDTDSDDDGLLDGDEELLYGTDPASADSDGDGMPDGWEIANGFDPTDFVDGSDDADGDSRSNADEYEQGTDPFADDVAPILRLPADVNINSQGVLTDVQFGSATAKDARDGALDPVSDDQGPFPSGPNIVTWSVSDEAGNVATADQRVDVVPLASFAVDQTVTERSPVQAVVELNGRAVEYPVVVPYSVAGTATNPEDHDAADGAVTINEGVRGEVSVNIVTDQTDEPDETLVLQMGATVNAVAGVKSEHTITIAETNVGPLVNITAWQGVNSVTTVVADGGPVFVTAEIVDVAADGHIYDWSNSDSGVTNPADLADDSFEFDPSALSEGVYQLRLLVTDNGSPIGISDVSSLLRVVATAPALDDAIDSDGDGISDADEGFGDSDGDRVPDYLDDIPNSNALRIDGNGRTLETETGLTLRLGRTIFDSGTAYAGIREDSVGKDVDFGYPSGLVDFEISGLAPSGDAKIVIPLVRPIPTNAQYRKYSSGAWGSFVEDMDNTVESAAGANGACPPPGDGRYEPGLIVGNGCIQLTIQDGGPNDADSDANGVILDPGGLGVEVNATLLGIAVPDSTVIGSGEVMVLRFRLQSESGDVVLSALQLQADGAGNDTEIRAVRLFVDVNQDGVVDTGDTEIGTGQYLADDGLLRITMPAPYEVSVGVTEFLVQYEL